MEGSSKSEVLDAENRIPDVFAAFRMRATELGMDDRAADLAEEFIATGYQRGHEDGKHDPLGLIG